jgi:hypothetical protein
VKAISYKSSGVSVHLWGLFARIVADEAHAIKTIRTRNHQAVALLYADHFGGQTATPMWNRPIDLCGYLVQLYWDGATEENPTGRLDRDAVLDEYLAWVSADNAAADANHPGQEEDTDPPYHLLAPQRLAVLAGRGDMTARQGLIVLPVILKMVCLARDIGDRMDISPLGENAEWVHIGKEIPPLAVTTIELTHTAESRAFHREAFLRIITVAGLKPKRGGPKPPAVFIESCQIALYSTAN